ncbi:uncharacterized protein LOC119670667 [Teleopsis dalmanni]|uniref:uncharacterized protein LOC119670667 n=1 Tax=Teleopsis dalmanni TaxID=139649 RepID=UPI0018CF04E0|nr:uncharacterized protein LOC119670667 [Teleopsis dalmanni]
MIYGWYIIFFICFAIITVVNGVIRPSGSLYLMDDEGFITYLEVPKSFGTVKNCWFKFRDDDKINIELNATAPITTSRNEIVLPFSSTICGIRVNNISSASAAVWTLEAENIYGDFEQDSVNVQILPAQKTRFDTHIQRELGKGSIACTKHDSYTKHCKIVDKQSNESWNQCEVYTTIRPNISFECLTYNWGRMQESYEHIFVETKERTVYTTASMEDNNNTSVILRCQFSDTLQSCQAEMPDHKNEIYIMDGMYNGRYSTYDTLISKSRCALEIPKPLAEVDMGLWRVINYNTGTPTGCLFYVGETKQDIIMKEIDMSRTIKTLKIYEPISDSDKTIAEMYCMLPFVIDDCYLRDPNNTVYFPDSLKFERSRQYGKCIFSNVPAIAGIWICGARGHDYEKEVLQEIEVIMKPRGGGPVNEEMTIKRSNTVQLMCKSPFEEPLTHCSFIDPNSHVHLVATVNSVKTAGHVQYSGRGIKYGDCGIKIKEVSANDFGQWKCQFIIANGKLESAFVMQLTELPMKHATSVGLAIGVTVIILLVLGVVIGTVFYRRRNLSAQHNFPSADPLDSTNSVVTATTQT